MLGAEPERPLIFTAVMGFGISGGRARGFKQLFM